MSNQHLQDAIQAIVEVQTAKASPILRQYFSGHARLEAQESLKAALPDLEMHFRQKIAAEVDDYAHSLQDEDGNPLTSEDVIDGLYQAAKQVREGADHE